MHGLEPGGLADELPRPLSGALQQHGGSLADHRAIEGELLLVDQCLEPLQPLVLHRFGHLIVHLRGGGSGPRGIFERVGLRVVHRPDQIQRLLELGVGLARETDDEVARQSNVGARGPHPAENG